MGFLKNVGTALDFFDVLKFGMGDGLDTDSPLGSMGIGGLGTIGGSFALVFSVAGLLVKRMKEEDDIVMEEIVQQELAQAKLSGLAGVEKFVSDWGHNEKYKFELDDFPEKTVNKILNGSIETFEDVRLQASKDQELSTKYVKMLYRKIYNYNKEISNVVIETIFIDE